MEDNINLTFKNIQEFITQTNRQLSHLIDKIGLDRDQFLLENEIVSCPINVNHRIPRSSLEKHTKKCMLKEQGFYNQIEIPTSKFFYQPNSSVSSILTDYSNVEINAATNDDNCTSSATIVSEIDQDSSVIDPKDIMTLESSNQLSDINIEHKDISTDIEYETIPMEKIKKIHSWKAIPKNYLNIDTLIMDPNTIKSWIIKNLPKTNYLESVMGSEIEVTNIIIRNLHSQTLCQPNKLVRTLWFALQSKGQEFVLELWKFLWTMKISHQYKLDQVSEGVITTVNYALSPDKMACIFTPEQRLAIYEDIIKRVNAMKPKTRATLEELQIDFDTIQELCNNNTDKTKSHLEVLAEQRDYKRRRQTYRAKNVHITKRTPTQVHRDLIELQMKYLESMIGDSSHSTESINNDSRNEVTNNKNIASQKTDTVIDEQLKLKSRKETKSDRRERRHDSADEHYSHRHRSHFRDKPRSHSSKHSDSDYSQHHHRRSKDDNHHHRHHHKHKKSHNK
ncbi:uncharacterized protein TRIADDRAFT_61126 [Trichoplax adhaerens]|uniref:CHHC U11-48K-type domain-containing protein n=1 Tax=Trichoplax adhaerens TaxID=10228 RepID=B3SA41_TRIAD|nr:hypothetical protein TRIADDRAFT_61126 [Trichoplax adhaerens]EDV20454.1 hypothetical protein TRIADDRAFT_61126 [Trichoplax adhaerens]|eukprot:XP_002117148.1 hypothetical protein TRIADDRAFT_61126 [Trichoplax adhaerens]